MFFILALFLYWLFGLLWYTPCILGGLPSWLRILFNKFLLLIYQKKKIRKENIKTTLFRKKGLPEDMGAGTRRICGLIMQKTEGIRKN